MRTKLTRGSFGTPSANTYLLMPDPTDPGYESITAVKEIILQELFVSLVKIEYR
jgi:hypothetical protein